jgi:hypothetical protein
MAFSKQDLKELIFKSKIKPLKLCFINFDVLLFFETRHKQSKLIASIKATDRPSLVDGNIKNFDDERYRFTSELFLWPNKEVFLLSLTRFLSFL